MDLAQCAVYSSSIEIVCGSCGKRRVVYFQFKPTKSDITAARRALVSTRYVCGGRISSFGRSLAVMEEMFGVDAGEAIVEDEIGNSSMVAGESEAELVVDRIDVLDEIFDSELEQQPDQKRNRKSENISHKTNPMAAQHPVVYGGDELTGGVGGLPGDDQAGAVDGQRGDWQEEGVGGGYSEKQVSKHGDKNCSGVGPCAYCTEILETGHKCRICLNRCCNLCNRLPLVEELSDIICPECFENQKIAEHENEKVAVNSQVRLFPLFQERKELGSLKRLRGRPRKVPSDDTAAEPDRDDAVIVDENDNEVRKEEEPVELRILENGNILTKMFVSEALTCDDQIEPHLYDILQEAGGQPPCIYCGEGDHGRMYSVMTEEKFPLCKACHELGRGAGNRRKGRSIKPKPLKPKKVLLRKNKQGKKQKLFIE